MLTAKEAAAVLGLKPRTIYDLAKAGKLACHRMGLEDGAVRFDPADLEEYKNRCRSPATTQDAGCISSAVQLPGSDSDLTSYFRKAGRAPKLTDSTSKRQRAKSLLQLVSASGNT